ncbi:hypothetical protein F5X99DRAFT_116747 [Biscogniauxia marginata]|nr:hypothetical protein F5X99DRAFT_116747 [Biscogniauxia marginata]
MDLASNHSALTTYGGWAVIAAGVGYYIYQRRQKQARRATTVKQPGRQNDVVSDAKKKSEKATKPKPKPKAPSNTTTEATSSSVKYNWEEAEAADKKADREFARQLANTHAGTKFASKKSDEKRQKSVKQSKAQEIDSNVIPEKTSVSSSTTGDADDDLSPQTSPVVAAADSRDVSDMLEPTAPGPSVLRLTDTDSVKKPKERKAKAPEPVETKKQRQNRKKAEAAKAAREEEEKERKVKMEQQRRTARIAEGRAAKDGSAFAANTQNAWDAKPTNGGDKIQLLDTSEQQPKREPAKPATPVPAPAATTKVTTDSWSAGMPSEEEQMEMLRQEDSWSEVKTKKGKKKNIPADTTSGPVVNGGNNVKSTQPQATTNGTKKPVLTSSGSSFAALTPDETDDNDEAEKEWDV